MDNTEGVIEAFAKNGEVNRAFSEIEPPTADPRGFEWNNFVKKEMKKGNILVYKSHKNGKNLYLVLKEKKDIFLKKYPLGVIVDN
jgi:hypothetical protein